MCISRLPLCFLCFSRDVYLFSLFFNLDANIQIYVYDLLSTVLLSPLYALLLSQSMRKLKKSRIVFVTTKRIQDFEKLPFHTTGKKERENKKPITRPRRVTPEVVQMVYRWELKQLMKLFQNLYLFTCIYVNVILYAL